MFDESSSDSFSHQVHQLWIQFASAWTVDISLGCLIRTLVKDVGILTDAEFPEGLHY